ncbi:MAG TPA: ATP-binding cassette domain-containing protein [Thermoplasmata archaeon]|nr:ATP-binding cassette domain-containing protein [Thermoplasmata archaeon]
MTDPIVAEELAKTYGGKVKAVQGVSFTVKEGEVFGFLGPNGAGKTTTVQMLTANLRPTSGRGMTAGLDIAQRPEEVKRRIGLVFQESTADSDLTGRENLELQAALYSVPNAEGHARIESLLHQMQVAEAADRPVKTYSGGMRRRLELAVGLVHNPKILFLDEPTLGLDPQGRAGFWRYIQDLRKELGLTVFLTTHYLDEADNLCDRLAIIDHGKIVATGTPAQLKDNLGGDVVTVRIQQTDRDLTPLFQAIPGATSVQVQDGAYRIKCASGEQLVPVLVESAFKSGVTVTAVSLKRPSLDEVFLEYTGREFREDESGPTATDMAVRIGQVRQGMGRGGR